MKFLLIIFIALMGCEGGEFTGTSLPQSPPTTGTGDLPVPIKPNPEVPPSVKDPIYRSASFVLSTTREIPLVKTVLIVDNSNSMGDEQELLASGVATFMNQLKGKNVDLYLYTTSTFSGWMGRYVSGPSALFQTVNNFDRTINMTNGALVNHSANAAIKANAWFDVNYAWTDASGGLVTSATAPVLGSAPYSAEFSYYMQKNLFDLDTNKPLSIRPDTSDADLDIIKAKLISSIKAGTSGSDVEEGLCTLVRLVNDQGPNKIFSPGDNVAFVVLTDEEDQSDVRSCVPSRKLTQITSQTIAKTYDADCSANPASCPNGPTHRRFRMRLDYNQIAIKCSESKTVDGVVTLESTTHYKDIWECAAPGNCQFAANTACTPEQWDRYGKVGRSPQCLASVESCKVSSSQMGATAGKFATREVTFPLATTNTFAQNCQNVFNQMNQVANRNTHLSTCQHVIDWAKDVSYNTQVVNGAAISHSLNYFSPNQKTAAEAGQLDKKVLIDHFVAKSKEVFGENGFFFSAIIRDTLEDQGHNCPTSTGSHHSPGVTYRKVAESLGSLGTVHSICDTQYDVALAKVENFIKLVTDSTHQLSINPGEKVAKVTRIRAGVAKVLVFGVDVVVTGGKLELKDYNKDDIYNVEIEEPAI